MVFRGNFNPRELEEKILEFWDKHQVFQRSLEKTKNGKPYTFYDGPPFATGLPHYGHILASTIKDVIPRYQTMNGRFVRRRWGWDCHGLPIEEIVERHLGISGKKQIEEIGIEKFNRTCREKVLEFAEEWGKMIRRIARWVDFENSYKTMDRDYMESVWWAFKQLYDKGLVYEGRKVLLYCPRCETPVSNFEVAMDNSYREVTTETVTVGFRVKPAQKIGDWSVPENVYMLAWTTTPWTLPGNVALAVKEEITYAVFSPGQQAAADGRLYIAARDRLAALLGSGSYEVLREVLGKELIGLKYESLFDVPALKNDKAFSVYAADFVSTEEGTGIVHTAVVYGEEDFELGQKVGLPVVPLLDEKGRFNEQAPEFLRGKYFQDANPLIISELKERRRLFRQDKITHSYPHCWRCGNPLFYNAIPAWFINIQKLKPGLLESNAREINWFPAHLKFGRYQKSVESAPDWNISRNRYWGNPIPVWKCEGGRQGGDSRDVGGCGNVIVVGSIRELGLSSNTFYFARHGESEKNASGVVNGRLESDHYDLTSRGLEQAEELAAKVKSRGGVDIIFTSDFLRTRKTAEIVGRILGVEIKTDPRLREYNTGIFEGRREEEYRREFAAQRNRWLEAPPEGETWMEVQRRMLGFIKEVDSKYRQQRILVISHGDPLWLVQKYYGSELPYPACGELFEINVGIDDLHRPYIDRVVLKCPRCGGEARRVKEIFDSWIEAGSMPFAEYHYPFDQKEIFESRLPAQFVAEYIAQTRAWFYVMHVIAYALFGKAPFENVVTTGTILAEDGSKMSKSRGNFPDPWEVINKYGVDALRFYLMNSVVMQADNLNFSLREVEIIYRRVITLWWNVYNYYAIYSRHWGYAGEEGTATLPTHILDRWLCARTKELVNQVRDYLDNYDTVRATRVITNYVDDLSTWYLRRSRGRREKEFFSTLRLALLTLARVAAPITPYIAEAVYLSLKTDTDPLSVHLTAYPPTETLTEEEKRLLREMAVIREAASLGQAIRKKLGIPLRQPLPRVAFFVREEMVPTSELMKILLEELNVKKFDPRLPEEKGESVAVLSGVSRVLNLYLDTFVAEDLRLEGLVRSLERAIQELRKKHGFKVGEAAALIYETPDSELEKAVELFNRERTYISEIRSGDGGGGEEIEIKGKKIKLALERL